MTIIQITLVDVSVTHGHRTAWPQPALSGLTLSIRRGERLLVTGPNGSGKSTFAWLLAGLIEPTNGEAKFEGRPLSDAKADIGILVQHTRLQLLRPTIGEELADYTDLVGDRLRALQAMGFSSIDAGRRIDDLSVGQQRRVGLAAQLARRAKVLVLDEPMAGLDHRGRDALISAIEQLPDHVTIITVTHDPEASRPLGNRVLQLDAGCLVADRVEP